MSERNSLSEIDFFLVFEIWSNIIKIKGLLYKNMIPIATNKTRTIAVNWQKESNHTSVSYVFYVWHKLWKWVQIISKIWSVRSGISRKIRYCGSRELGSKVWPRYSRFRLILIRLIVEPDCTWLADKLNPVDYMVKIIGVPHLLEQNYPGSIARG
jgi:hypothetical protein